MKKISTLVGIVIIIVAVAIIFGGVFAYQYFATQKNIPINNTQNINQPKNTAVTSQPSITITSPNGGKSYSAGIIPVSFTTNAPVGNEYEMDIIGTPNNGSAYKYVDMYGYVQSGTTQNNSVNIPADIQTGKYKVVVIVYNGNSKNDPILCQDLSDNYFDINIAKITITSPSGGEVWKVGETHDITKYYWCRQSYHLGWKRQRRFQYVSSRYCR